MAHRSLITLLVLLLSAAGAARTAAQAPLDVPALLPSPVLVDGRFTDPAWRAARVVALDDSTELLLMQSEGHVYLGVRTRTRHPRYLDLFLRPDGGDTYNLHASMQIGERLLPDAHWDDRTPPYRWGNHVDWIANEAKLDPAADAALPFAARLYPSDGYEVQLRRSRFQGAVWHLRVEVRDFTGAAPDLVYPAASRRDRIDTWARLALGTP